MFSEEIHSLAVLALLVCALLLCNRCAAPQLTDERIPSDKRQLLESNDESKVSKGSVEDKEKVKLEPATLTNNTDLIPVTDLNATTPSPPPPTPVDPLPAEGAAETEHKSSMAIFFILFVIVLSILLVHMLLITKFHYLPESVAIIFLGVLIGGLAKLSGKDWTSEEAFPPNIFFLILLPPIIFESGYNLHKGNFFANIGSILVFAIFGTLISAFVMGGGIIILGEADLIYRLSPIEGFAFGSMVSAVDPVATLAIFQAIDVDPILYMLVFGESVLNDAVAIVLTNTISELEDPSMASLSTSEAVWSAILRFCAMFFGSAALGVAAALTSALMLKHIDLRRTPSLEFAIMFVFAYLPYGLAEGLHLSGIMAILFCGIVMSHYTHFNLSPITQLNMQMTFRTLAFVSETCVFAYLGMAFFTYNLEVEPVLITWSIVLCLISRACNIFPLSWALNHFRDHVITKRMQCIMWFSGLRGAIAFALSLHTSFNSDHTRMVVITTTLCLVLFTTVVLGGSTMPLLKFLEKMSLTSERSRRKRRRRSDKKHRSASPSLIKTHGIGDTVDARIYSEYSESESAFSAAESPATASLRPVTAREKGFARLDNLYFRPFFTRKFTSKEKRENTLHLTDLALQWFQDAQSEDSDSLEAMSPPQNDGMAAKFKQSGLEDGQSSESVTLLLGHKSEHNDTVPSEFLNQTTFSTSPGRPSLGNGVLDGIATLDPDAQNSNSQTSLLQGFHRVDNDSHSRPTLLTLSSTSDGGL